MDVKIHARYQTDFSIFCMKYSLVILVIIIILIGGYFLFSNKEDVSLIDDENTEYIDTQDSSGDDSLDFVTEASLEGSFTLTESIASYIAQKKFFQKPTQEVIGTTNKVTGEVVVDSENVFSLVVEIDTKDFDTGQFGRDVVVKDLFSTPASITVSGVSVDLSNGVFEIDLVMSVSVNGITQDISFVTRLERTAEDVVVVDARGEMSLESFGITAPSVANVYTVDDVIGLTIQTMAKRE